MELDKKSFIPLYHQLADVLREKIESGEWVAGEAIPSEASLMEAYGISRGTVREAIKLLVWEGLLVTLKGKGTYVATPKIAQDTRRVIGFTKLMIELGHVPTAKVLNFEHLPAPKIIAEKLRIPPESPVTLVQRLRMGDGEPLVLEHSYYRYDVGKHLSEEDLRGSIYDVAEMRFGVRVVYAEQEIEATIAAEEEASLLGVEVGAPLLLLRRVAYSQGNRPLEYAEDLYRADRTRFHVTTDLSRTQLNEHEDVMQGVVLKK